MRQHALAHRDRCWVEGGNAQATECPENCHPGGEARCGGWVERSVEATDKSGDRLSVDDGRQEGRHGASMCLRAVERSAWARVRESDTKSGHLESKKRGRSDQRRRQVPSARGNATIATGTW